MKRTVVVLLAIAIVALFVWQTQLPDAPPADDQRAHGARPAAALVTTAGNGQSNASDKAGRTEVVTKKPTDGKAAEGIPWTIQFDGIDPAVPWTAPVQIVFEGRFDTTIKVDADGIARFVPPPDARNPGNQTLRLISSEPNYRFAAAHGRTDNLQAFGSMSFQVYPVARLQGRVLDPKGQPITARVRAYPWRHDGPAQPIVAFTLTSADGTFDLQVPPATQVFVIADVEADEPWTSFALPLDRFGKSNSLQTLATQAQNPIDPTVLPATTRAIGTFGKPERLADLELRAAAKLTGTVKSRDGRPLPFATVTARPAWADQNDRQDLMHWSPAHGSVRGGSTTTDPNGAFTLDLLGGVPFHVSATSVQPAMLAGEPETTTTAPRHIDLIAPGDWLDIDVEDAGTPVFAWIDIGSRTLKMMQAGGLPVLLPPAPTRARARFGNQASEWIDIPVAGRPGQLTLELNSRKLPPVRITAKNVPDLREVHCHWQPLPSGPAWHAPAVRASADLPFTTHVPIGKYVLTMRDVEDPKFPGYLMPHTVQVEVTAAGCDPDVDLQFGGGIQLSVRDANGTRLAGTFQLKDARGLDVTPATIAQATIAQESIARATMSARRGKVGELLAINTNRLSTVLAPGDYTLSVNVPGRGSAQRDVKVEPRRRSFVEIVIR